MPYDLHTRGHHRLLVVLLMAAAAVALGDSTGAAAPDDAASPRAAISAYLEAARAGDWTRAAAHLDLRRIPPASRAQRGPALARDLKTVLDQTLVVDLDQVSDAPQGLTDDGLPADLERLGTITARKGPADVLLQRVAGDGGAPAWRIAASTVEQIPTLAREFASSPIQSRLPAPLVDIRVLDIALWQWIGILLIVLAAVIASWIVALIVVALLRPVVRRSRTALDERLLDVMAGPLRLAIGLLLVGGGALFLTLPLPARDLFIGIEKAVAVVAVSWFVLRAIDVFGEVAVTALAERGSATAVGLVPIGRKAAKVTVFVLAVIAVLQNVGVNVTGLLAGLGVGGLAVALAAQKTVENLFGGVTLLLDQPVRVGDFCRFGDKIGTVEEVGLRSTRVRTLDRTVVSIPNGEFSSMQLENFARRDRIWLKTVIGLRYETSPDQLRWVLVEIRKMLYAHPRVHPEPARIRFVGFGAYSLDLEIFAYVLTADFGEFLAIREDIYLRIMDIVAASGSGFAFPSQTTYFARDGGLDEARTHQAERQVEAWRGRDELHLPEFPAGAIAALDDTLAYPPRGSSVRPAPEPRP